jgi:hypothetical protein
MNITAAVITQAKIEIAEIRGLKSTRADEISDEYAEQWIIEQSIAQVHLEMSAETVARGIVRASIRENNNTNRIIVEDAREQVAYWTLVLTTILNREGFFPASDYANRLIEIEFYKYSTGN